MNTLKRYTRNALIALVVLLTIRVYWFVPPEDTDVYKLTFSKDGRYMAGVLPDGKKGSNHAFVLLQSREEGSRGKTLAIARENIETSTFHLGFYCASKYESNESEAEGDDNRKPCVSPDIFYWDTAGDTQLSLPVPLWRRADAWLISLFYTLPVLPQNPAKAAE